MRIGELYIYAVYGVALVGMTFANMVGSREMKNDISDLAIQLTDY